MTPPAYTTDDNYDAIMHSEFKRDADAQPGTHASASSAPIFEKYSFVSPGKPEANALVYCLNKEITLLTN